MIRATVITQKKQDNMDKIKNLLIGCMMVVAAVALQSCDDDDDSYGYNYVQPTAIVTVKPNADNTSFVMQLNDSVRLTPTNMGASPFGKKEVRALVSYSPAEPYKEDARVAVNWVDSILTKGAARNLGDGNEAEYGADPVEIINSWETCAEDGYLTLRFRTNWAGYRPHSVNIVHRTDANMPYLLEFYHNANGDTGGNPSAGAVGDGLVAFRIDTLLKITDRTEEITLKWKSYKGEKTTTFKLKPRKDV